eukprot:4479658-Amphidinium_carterae.4
MPQDCDADTGRLEDGSTFMGMHPTEHGEALARKRRLVASFAPLTTLPSNTEADCNSHSRRFVPTRPTFVTKSVPCTKAATSCCHDNG